MHKVANALACFCRDESGAQATEYVLLVALVAVAAMFGGATLGESLNVLFTKVNVVVRDAAVMAAS